jgi:mRNA degradation ribonuclease J1/J2
VVVVVLAALTDPSQPAIRPRIVTSGFMETRETVEIFERLTEQLDQLLLQEPELRRDPEAQKSRVREVTRRFISTETRRRPMIIPVILGHSTGD